MKALDDLTEREVLALAFSNEEVDGRIYADFAHSLQDDYPDTAGVFDDMAEEEDGHRRSLIDLFADRFGPHIPLVRRADGKGNLARKPVWQVRPLDVEAVRRQAAQMERDAERFYRQAAARSTDAAACKLLGDIAEDEVRHQRSAGEVKDKRLPGDVRAREDEDAKRRFVLQVIQPGLVGLRDGSVSTLAPVFAAFATHVPWNAFLVGLARRRHLDGLRRGADRRQGAVGPRHAAAPRAGVWADDGGGRHRTHAALCHLRFLDGDGRGGRDGSGGRAFDHRLDPVEVHGHAAHVGGRQGHAGRRARDRHRRPDRQRRVRASVRVPELDRSGDPRSSTGPQHERAS